MSNAIDEAKDTIAGNARHIEKLLDDLLKQAYDESLDINSYIQHTVDSGWYGNAADEAGVFPHAVRSLSQPCYALETAGHKLTERLNELDDALTDAHTTGSVMSIDKRHELIDIITTSDIVPICSDVSGSYLVDIYNVCDKAISGVHEFDCKLCDMSLQGIGFDDDVDIRAAHAQVVLYYDSLIAARDTCMVLTSVANDVKETVFKLLRVLNTDNDANAANARVGSRHAINNASLAELLTSASVVVREDTDSIVKQVHYSVPLHDIEERINDTAVALCGAGAQADNNGLMMPEAVDALFESDNEPLSTDVLQSLRALASASGVRHELLALSDACESAGRAAAGLDDADALNCTEIIKNIADAASSEDLCSRLTSIAGYITGDLLSWAKNSAGMLSEALSSLDTPDTEWLKTNAFKLDVKFNELIELFNTVHILIVPVLYEAVMATYKDIDTLKQSVHEYIDAK